MIGGLAALKYAISSDGLSKERLHRPVEYGEQTHVSQRIKDEQELDALSFGGVLFPALGSSRARCSPALHFDVEAARVVTKITASNN